jgi:hypothetical protein
MRRENTRVEGLTGRQARAGETTEKLLASKQVFQPQMFSGAGSVVVSENRLEIFFSASVLCLGGVILTIYFS